MNRKKLIRLGVGILFAAFLAGCDKTPTEPDPSPSDTTGTGKSVFEIVKGWLS